MRLWISLVFSCSWAADWVGWMATVSHSKHQQCPKSIKEMGKLRLKCAVLLGHALFCEKNAGTGQHRRTKQKQRFCQRVHSSDVFCVKTWSNDATEKKGQGKTGKRRTTLLRMLGGRLGAVLLANASQKMRWSRRGDQIITAKTPRS